MRKHPFPTLVLTGLLLLGGGQGPAWAAEEGFSAAAPSPAPVDRNEGIRDQIINFRDIPSLIKNPTFVTLRYDNADLREVLRLVAHRGGMNLVLDESVSGRFSIDVRAVPLDEFFAIVLRTNGLAARRVGTSLLIAKEDQLRSRVDATQAATFRLNNATAKDVATILEKVLGGQGGGGGGGGAGGAQGGGVRITVDDRTNSILVVGTGEDLARIRNTIRAVDVPAPQVMIEVQLVEIGVNHLRQLEGQLGFGGSKFGFANNVTSVQSTANGQPAGGVPASGGGTSVTFSSMGNVTANLQARVNALVRNGSARVLANPRVTTQDNYTAVLQIQNKVPVLRTNFQSGNGAAVATESVSFEPIGEELNITPRIDTNGFVTMVLEPKMSVRGNDVIVNRNTVPEINERTVKTQVRVADGETVVIGGLIRKNLTRAVAKMPILGDLPAVGFLFRNETQNEVETEIIIMVTPHITNALAPGDPS